MHPGHLLAASTGRRTSTGTLTTALAPHRSLRPLRAPDRMLERGGFQLDPRLLFGSSPLRIRCPACRWQPGRAALWYCTSTGHPEYFEYGCGHGWNTFDTRGRCPGCSYQWRYTSCLACGQWALHEHWYEVNDGRPEP